MQCWRKNWPQNRNLERFFERLSLRECWQLATVFSASQAAHFLFLHGVVVVFSDFRRCSLRVQRDCLRHRFLRLFEVAEDFDTERGFTFARTFAAIWRMRTFSSISVFQRHFISEIWSPWKCCWRVRWECFWVGRRRTNGRLLSSPAFQCHFISNDPLL